MEQVMNQKDVKVSFYLKKSEADASGNCPVMARLIVGKHSETAFSVKLRVPQSLWSSGRACERVLRPGKSTASLMKSERQLSAFMRKCPQSVKM